MFNTTKQVIGEDIDIPMRELPGKRQPLMEHDKPFRPSHPPKIGYNKTLGRFPEYIEDPKKPLEQSIEVKEKSPKNLRISSSKSTIANSSTLTTSSPVSTLPNQSLHNLIN